MSKIRCALARLIPDEPDPERTKRDGWRNHRILVASLDDPRLDFAKREMVRLLGNFLYGEKD